MKLMNVQNLCNKLVLIVCCFWIVGCASYQSWETFYKQYDYHDDRQPNAKEILGHLYAMLPEPYYADPERNPIGIYPSFWGDAVNVTTTTPDTRKQVVFPTIGHPQVIFLEAGQNFLEHLLFVVATTKAIDNGFELTPKEPNGETYQLSPKQIWGRYLLASSLNTSGLKVHPNFKPRELAIFNVRNIEKSNEKEAKRIADGIYHLGVKNKNGDYQELHYNALRVVTKSPEKSDEFTFIVGADLQFHEDSQFYKGSQYHKDSQYQYLKKFYKAMEQPAIYYEKLKLLKHFPEVVAEYRRCDGITQEEKYSHLLKAIKDAVFVIVVGDLVDQGSSSLGFLGHVNSILNLPFVNTCHYDTEYPNLFRLLRDSPKPTFLIPGNHDGMVVVPGHETLTLGISRYFSKLFNSDIEDGLMYWQTLFGPTYYSFPIKNLQFLCLNSYEVPAYFRLSIGMISPNSGGYLSENQVNWVKTATQNSLKRSYKSDEKSSGKYNECLVFMHHDPTGGTPVAEPALPAGLKNLQSDPRETITIERSGQFHRFNPLIQLPSLAGTVGNVFFTFLPGLLSARSLTVAGPQEWHYHGKYLSPKLPEWVPFGLRFPYFGQDITHRKFFDLLHEANFTHFFFGHNDLFAVNPPGTRSAHLFSVPSQCQNLLDENVLPKKILNELQKRELPISSNHEIEIKERNREWAINDFKTTDRRPTKEIEYVVRKEENDLNVYRGYAFWAQHAKQIVHLDDLGNVPTSECYQKSNRGFALVRVTRSKQGKNWEVKDIINIPLDYVNQGCLVSHPNKK